MNETKPTVKALLLTQAQALRASADVLEAQAAALPDGGAGDPWLDLEQVQAEFGWGRGAVFAAVERGELELRKGARRKILVRRSAIDACIASRPYKPQPRKAEPEAQSFEDFDRQVLRSLKGGRK